MEEYYYIKFRSKTSGCTILGGAHPTTGEALDEAIKEIKDTDQVEIIRLRDQAVVGVLKYEKQI